LLGYGFILAEPYIAGMEDKKNHTGAENLPAVYHPSKIREILPATPVQAGRKVS
jgi:hypothetical protein